MEKDDSKKSKDRFSSSIPSELLEENIISRLPIKSLCRFKSVSKSWRSLFETPTFLEKVRPKQPFQWQIDDPECVLVYSIADDGTATLVDSYYFEGRSWDPRYCDGLICFRDEQYILNVFNPTTGELMKLVLENITFEFGFDPSSRKYKILFWTRETPSVPAILTLENNSTWRVVQQHAPNFEYWMKNSSSAYASGRLFWLVYASKPAHIISFNLSSEKFEKIELPCMIKGQGFRYTLFEFEGSLCLVEHSLYHHEVERGHLEIINLWMLKDIDSSFWISLIKNILLPLEGTDMGDYSRQWDRKAYFFSRRGEIVVAAADGNGEEHIIFIYNFLNRQFKRIKISGIMHSSDKDVNNHVDNYISFKDIVRVNGRKTSLYEYHHTADYSCFLEAANCTSSRESE